MKKILPIFAVLVGLGLFAAPKAEAFVAINIGVPVPPVAYVGAPYGPYYYGYYSYPVFGFWPGGYWHGTYWARGYYNRAGYGRHAYVHRSHH